MRLLRPAALACSLALASCAGAAPVTKIERGEVYKTGTPKYDEYFEEVVNLRTEAAKAVGERHRVEDQLRAAIGATAKSVEDLLDGARKKAGELKERGHLLHLQLTPEVRLFVARTPQAKPDPTTEKLAHDIEEAVKNSIVLATKLRELRAKAEGLERRRDGLVGEAQATFAKEGDKRTVVDRELDMSKKVLDLAREDGEKQAGLASYLVIELATALETGAVPGAPPPKLGWKPPPGVAHRPPPPKPAATGQQPPPPPPQGPTKPASTQAKPPPPPPKKPPKKGGDFDP